MYSWAIIEQRNARLGRGEGRETETRQTRDVASWIEGHQRTESLAQHFQDIDSPRPTHLHALQDPLSMFER